MQSGLYIHTDRRLMSRVSPGKSSPLLDTPTIKTALILCRRISTLKIYGSAMYLPLGIAFVLGHKESGPWASYLSVGLLIQASLCPGALSLRAA